MVGYIYNTTFPSIPFFPPSLLHNYPLTHLLTLSLTLTHSLTQHYTLTHSHSHSNPPSTTPSLPQFITHSLTHPFPTLALSLQADFFVSGGSYAWRGSVNDPTTVSILAIHMLYGSHMVCTVSCTAPCTVPLDVVPSITFNTSCHSTLTTIPYHINTTPYHTPSHTSSRKPLNTLPLFLSQTLSILLPYLTRFVLPLSTSLARPSLSPLLALSLLPLCYTSSPSLIPPHHLPPPPPLSLFITPSTRFVLPPNTSLVRPSNPLSWLSTAPNAGLPQSQGPCSLVG